MLYKSVIIFVFIIINIDCIPPSLSQDPVGPKRIGYGPAAEPSTSYLIRQTIDFTRYSIPEICTQLTISSRAKGYRLSMPSDCSKNKTTLYLSAVRIAKGYLTYEVTFFNKDKEIKGQAYMTILPHVHDEKDSTRALHQLRREWIAIVDHAAKNLQSNTTSAPIYDKRILNKVEQNKHSKPIPSKQFNKDVPLCKERSLSKQRLHTWNQIIIRAKKSYRKRQYTEALKLFEAAKRICHTLSLKFNIASTMDKLGLAVEAYRGYKDYIARAKDQTSIKALKYIKQRKKELATKVVDLTVRLSPANAHLSIEGNEAFVPLIKTQHEAIYSIVLHPGKHTLRARLDHYETQQIIKVFLAGKYNETIKLEAHK